MYPSIFLSLSLSIYLSTYISSYLSNYPHKNVCRFFDLFRSLLLHLALGWQLAPDAATCSRRQQGMNTSPLSSPRRAASPKSARKSPKARGTKSPARGAASPQRRRPTGKGTDDLESPKPKSSPGVDQKSAKKELQGDRIALMLLLLLYTLQGIPMGLGASLPLLMVEKKVSSMEQAVFSMVAYPFAFKLLWAPLVDSVYHGGFGRRKSWIVPMQAIIGLLLLWAGGSRIDGWLGEGGGGKCCCSSRTRWCWSLEFATKVLLGKQI